MVGGSAMHQVWKGEKRVPYQLWACLLVPAGNIGSQCSETLLLFPQSRRDGKLAIDFEQLLNAFNRSTALRRDPGPRDETLCIQGAGAAVETAEPTHPLTDP